MAIQTKTDLKIQYLYLSLQSVMKIYYVSVSITTNESHCLVQGTTDMSTEGSGELTIVYLIT